MLDVIHSLLGRHHHIRLIVAHCSGEGINEKNTAFYMKLGEFCSTKVSFTNFSEDEARVFADVNNLKEIDFDQLKRMTNFNLLLLQEVKRQKSSIGKHMMT